MHGNKITLKNKYSENCAHFSFALLLHINLTWNSTVFLKYSNTIYLNHIHLEYSVAKFTYEKFASITHERKSFQRFPIVQS